MDCKIVGKKLSAYIDGELPFKEREAVGKHLGLCFSCSEEHRRLILIASLMDDIAVEDVSPFFADRVVNNAKTVFKTHHRRFLNPALACMGIIFIVVIGLIEFMPRGNIEAARYECLREFEDFPPDSFSDIYMTVIKGEAK
ncbi:MAG: hypothetical protein A2077_06870 [Nitrospirae bacterium GWC2_46_6]|nr:MAG: hypothetical protein A2077_06870 [Nitrospirae bacterium GWC2_46_6]OGW20938.1 MAG: hypothetical protein A2Z82_12165 [Nitrospirae bacterium GWA2_46_11]OGW23020.1 MAG: hypothetical protein A2X55_12675 [Nitrospirae bacterium GWB2_47_37]HAK88364.1 hypothetical protein [Nitrospiraceae bacterium]HCL81829.1 hypothetical protein [Nitrospiraceae bacterium]